MAGREFAEVARLPVDPGEASVYAEGWQSWSPTCAYRWDDRQPVAVDARQEALGYRPGHPGPVQHGWQGEGLLAIRTAIHGPVVVVAAPSATDVPSIRALAEGDVLRVLADGPVTIVEHPAGTALEAALTAFGSGFRSGAGGRPGRTDPPTVWCSWYRYFGDVTAADIQANLGWMSDLDLPVDVVQIDDGYQRGIGDWLDADPRFGDLRAVVAAIRGEGRRAGIWLAPFLVGARSALAAAHPEWLLPEAWAGSNWGQELRVLDISRPAAAAHLSRVVGEFRAMGIDYFKLDFLYAGALAGPGESDRSALERYRWGLGLIAEAAGADAFIVGCGAPMLPSVGMVDAMRISPDVALHRDPPGGDLSAPSLRSALFTGRPRTWQNQVLWWADPDCLIAREQFAERELWASWVADLGGLRSASDAIGELDPRGLRLLRSYLGGQSSALAS